MKLTFVALLFLAVSSIANADISKKSSHCIKVGTLRCINGYFPTEENGCWFCKAQDFTQPLCIPSPVLECREVNGVRYVEMADEHGCFHCVRPKNVAEERQKDETLRSMRR
jgi:hypothetical protein